MRSRHALAALATFHIVFLCTPARAWNGTGHEVVALIAWDQLSPAQRSACGQILRGHPRFQKDLMQFAKPGEDPAEHAFREAAAWPDAVRTPTNPLSRDEHHAEWHYIDYPYDLDGKGGPRPAEKWDGHAAPTDLLQALQMVTAQLRDPATPAPRRAIDLCWVLHLVGDAHQPLHAVAEYSDAYPTGDRGGNLIHVATADNPDTNLHAVWDGIEGRSFDAAVIRKLADRIEKAHPRTSADVAATDPIVWARESFEIAKHDVYLDGKIVGATKEQSAKARDGAPPLPAGYERRAHEVADDRIALAGYRLADLLKSIVTPTTQP